MKKLPLLIVLSACSLFASRLALLARAAESKSGAPAPAAEKTNSVRTPIIDDPRLPRVLLIGDSISMGYTLGVRERLAGRANVHRPPENCGDTARGLAKLDAWLGSGRWDVIHFNFGLHDLKYLDANGKYVPPEKGRQVAPVAQYEENLTKLTRRLKQTGAKLIFATTTPVPVGTTGRVAHDEIAYNAVAVKVMQANGVEIDDLHALVKPRQARVQRPANVHFTPEGYALMAEVVAERIAQHLPGNAKAAATSRRKE